MLGQAFGLKSVLPTLIDLKCFFNARNFDISFGDEASIEAERNRRLQVFRQSYESLVSLVSLLVHCFGYLAVVLSLVKCQSTFSEYCIQW